MITIKGKEIKKYNELKEVLNNATKIDEINPIISHNIKEYSDKYELSGVDIEDLTGITRQATSTVENYKTTPRLEHALKLSTIFGVPVKELFTLNENAWVKQLKDDNNKTIYTDNRTGDIITNSERRKREKDIDYYFFDSKTEKKYKKNEGYKYIYNNNFETNLVLVFQRIGLKIKPIQLK